MWYQLDPADPANFCRRLKEQLGVAGVTDVALPGHDDAVTFAWSGDNDDAARRSAAESLAGRLQQIVRDHANARVHVIGHSHGGNVALKGIELRLRQAAVEAKALLRRALAGPADDIAASIERSIERSLPGANEGLRARARTMLTDAAAELRPHLERDFIIRLWPRAAPARLYFLLTTSGPVRDSANRFVSSWVAAQVPASVTCLGTPFYHKVWQGRRTVRFLRRLPGSIVAIVLLTAPTLYAVVMFYSALLALLPAVTMLSWNPLAWPLWLQGLIVLLIVVSIGVAGSEADTRDTNLYFEEEGMAWSPVHARIPALVISAGRLDEALLALSSEPFAFAFLIPQLRAMLSRGPRLPDPAGRVSTLSTIGTVPLQLLLRGIARIGYALVAPLWIPFRRWVLIPLMTEVLLRTVNASAFGVRSDELSAARIQVRSRINVPPWFDETYHEVTDVLLRTPPVAAPAARTSAAAARFDFLNDDARLVQKKEASVFWKRLQEALPELRARYGSADGPALEHELALNVIALEERIKQIAGSVDLNHSWYYSNDEVIEMIATFVARAAGQELAPR